MKASTQRAQQAEKVKNEILDAAIPLFARGYDTVSIQQIATQCGHKHSLVMYHFGNKETLWEQAMLRLKSAFDERHQLYYKSAPQSQVLKEWVYYNMLAFIKSLRDMPAYGQVLFCETAHESTRLHWLHQNFFPAVVNQSSPYNQTLLESIYRTTLVRNVVAGAILFSVVSGPQFGKSIELEGAKDSQQLYPLSDSMAEELARMLMGFLESQIDGF